MASQLPALLQATYTPVSVPTLDPKKAKKAARRIKKIALQLEENTQSPPAEEIVFVSKSEYEKEASESTVLTKESEKKKPRKRKSELVADESQKTEQEDVETDERPSKKHKTSRIEVQKEANDPPPELQERPRGDKDGAKKEDDGEGKSDSKFKNVLEKRKKSLKKAEALAKANIEKEAEDIREVEEPIELHDLVPLPQPEPAPQPDLPTTSALPPWLASPIKVAPDATKPFSDLGIGKEVVERLQNEGFSGAFAVQAAVLPLLLPGDSQQRGDILVSAATGSGKTLAYALPMIEDISKDRTTKLRGLVVLPTRELVHQAQKVCEICSAAFGAERDRKHVTIGTAVGNATLKAEQRALMEQIQVWDPDGYVRQQEFINDVWNTFARVVDDDALPHHVVKLVSKVDILICTPGRLVEHIKSLSLQNLKWLVVDEADKLMDQSYQQWLDLVKLPKRVRKIILSATMTKDVGQLNQLSLYRPKLVELGESERVHRLPPTLQESAIKVDDESIKPLYLLELLRSQNILPTNKTSPRILVFTSSTESTLRLSRLLALLSPPSASLISTLSSTTRNLDGPILIGTDLASRGLDLNLAHVINYDVPSSLTSYIHRIGRTARAGKEGHAWTLFSGTEGRWFWNEIARSELVERGVVARLTLKINAEEKKIYEVVLGELGKEAGR